MISRGRARFNNKKRFQKLYSIKPGWRIFKLRWILKTWGMKFNAVVVFCLDTKIAFKIDLKMLYELLKSCMFERNLVFFCL